MRFKLHEEGEEDGQGEFEHLVDVGDSVLGEGDAEILLHSRDEHLVGPGVSSQPQPAIVGDQRFNFGNKTQ
jgi:hypothetical protein